MPILVSVVGAAFPNRDGRCRRMEIACCVAGEPVQFVAEPDNRADPRAIAVYSMRGIQIGYVRARMTARVRRHLERGGEAAAVFLRRSLAGAELSLTPGPGARQAGPSWIGLYG